MDKATQPFSRVTSPLARQWVANAVFLLLAVFGCWTVSPHNTSLVVPTGIAWEIVEFAEDLWAPTFEGGLSFRGVNSQTTGSEWTLRTTASGETRYVFVAAGLMRPLRILPGMTLLLLVCAVVACLTWDLGWVRRLLTLLTALAAGLLLMPVVVGFLSGLAVGGLVANPESLRTVYHVIGRAGYVAVNVTVLALAGLWLLQKCLVVREAAEEDRVLLPKAAHTHPPTLLAAAGAVLCAVILLLLATWNGRAESGVLVEMLLLLLPAAFIGMAMARLRWAFIVAPLAAIPAGLAGTTLLAPMVFLLAVLAVNDMRTRAFLGMEMDEEEAAIILRRAERPLLPVVWVLVVTGAVGLTAVAVDLYAFPLSLGIPVRPPWLIALGGGASVLGLWECLSLKRSEKKGATRQALLAAILGVFVLIPACAAWALVPPARGSIEPVPWPAGVKVDEGFVMTSMPDRMGPFEFVRADGEIDFDSRNRGFRRDGMPDGEYEIPEDAKELLGIGTATDQKNLPLGKSNWLSIRTYRDNRRPPGDPLRYWCLEVYYFTGDVDLVPHLPETCAVAGGNIWVHTTDMPIHAGGSETATGDKPICFQRALFERSGMPAEPLQFVQYYIFWVNGQPRGDHKEVRLMLSSPFVRHAYFTKIQFAPRPVVQEVDGRLTYPMPDPEQTDAAVADFVKHFLPHILKTLPTAQDVAGLDEGDNG